jgi:hypothetical protein
MPSRKRSESRRKSRAIAEFFSYARAAEEIRSLMEPPRRADGSLPAGVEIEHISVLPLSEPMVLEDSGVYEAPDPLREVAQREVAQGNIRLRQILSRRFRKVAWVVSCLQQEDEARALLLTFVGIARILDALAANNQKPQPKAFADYLGGLLPTPAIRIELDNNKRAHVVTRLHPNVAQLRERFLEALDDLDTSLIRRCKHPKCRILFWARRKDQSCCTALHAHRLHSLTNYKKRCIRKPVQKAAGMA